MKFTPTRIEGVWLIELERRGDDRGHFARTFCVDEFKGHGLHAHFPQCNTSFNTRRGTLRGMHFQDDPHPEVKLVRCTRGAIFDVAVDLRPESATYKRWVCFELDPENGRALYVPAGCAHGFQTLTENAEVLYMMGDTYHPTLARGVRWNDPAFGIEWPVSDPFLSERDAGYADFAGP